MTMTCQSFLHFKSEYLKFPSSSEQSTTMFHFTSSFFQKISNFSTQHSKFIKIFSTGIIIYSSYYYFKCRSKDNPIQNSFFYRVKQLFSQRFGNTALENKKNNLALEVKELPEHVKYDNGWYVELDELKKTMVSASASASASASLDSSSGCGCDNHDAILNPLREITPRGEIIMYYDAEKKSFHYYSNSKNIPYSTLDAVARKYVCLHKDPSIYVDIRDEIQKGREWRTKKDKVDKSKLEINGNTNNKNGVLSSAKKSLFAVFKNYKTGRKSAPKSLDRYSYDGNVKVEEFVILKESINKFIYRGTLDQYESDLKCHKNQHRPNKKHLHSESKSESDSNAIIMENEENQNTFGDNNSENSSNNHTINHTTNDAAHSNCDYIQLNHEKEDLSYSEFKKKYNH